LCFDLTGLPPEPADLERFAADPSDAAWEAEVDRLLASPARAERLARMWLDVVRFAETNGFERDAAKPQAWRYRDWVVQAFATDLPYDAFLTAQLAGDERPDVAPDANVATGFWRIGPWDDEPNDREQARFDELDDQLRTITEGMLGVTVGCARCHDHRFDPLPQRDYYSLLAYFRNVAPYAKARHELESPVLAPLDVTPGDIEAWDVSRQAEIERARAELDELVVDLHRALLEEELAADPTRDAAAARAEFERLLGLPFEERHDALAAAGLPSTFTAISALPFEERQRASRLLISLDPEDGADFEGDLRWGLVVTEREGEPLPTHVLHRGLPSTPGEEVRPA
ncbi:MAG TPA: DUF1549 domain-containing protein, partial [Planctomycetota bacterium]|nr:DUF1549 domain-containing protein [Planctomycetota bacterium]